MREKELLKAPSLVGLPELVLEILIEKRHWKVTERNERDLGAGLAGTLGGDGSEFMIVGITAETPAEGKDTGFAHEMNNYWGTIEPSTEPQP